MYPYCNVNIVAQYVGHSGNIALDSHIKQRGRDPLDVELQIVIEDAGSKRSKAGLDFIKPRQRWPVHS